MKNAIVVYPEVVAGNPLGASAVVRWFLHKPGFHTGEVRFGESELYFYYLRAFDDREYNLGELNHLQITEMMSGIYVQTNFKAREGACYLIRKGSARDDVRPIEGATLLDGCSHQQIARIFNQKKYLYSYDEYTMYLIYAAVCGCIPIVIPKDGVSKTQWIPDEDARYGIAYGTSDIDWAMRTRGSLIAKLERDRLEEVEATGNFVKVCQDHFKCAIYWIADAG